MWYHFNFHAPLPKTIWSAHPHHIAEEHAAERLLEIHEKRMRIRAVDVDLRKYGEGDAVSLLHLGHKLFVWQRLLTTELVGGEG